MKSTGRHDGAPPSRGCRRSGRRSPIGFRDALNQAKNATVSGSRGSNYAATSKPSGDRPRLDRRRGIPDDTPDFHLGALADRRSATTREVSSIARRHDGADRIGVESPEFVENLRAARASAMRRRRAKGCGGVAVVSESDTAVPERPIVRQRHCVDLMVPR